MPEDSTILRELAILAAAGGLGADEQRVWVSEQSRRIHFDRDCRTTAIVAARPRPLADLEPDIDRFEACPTCGGTGRVLHASLNLHDWGTLDAIRDTLLWLRNDRDDQQRSRHVALTTAAVTGPIRHTEGALRAAITATLNRVEVALAEGREAGIERRLLWHHATTGAHDLHRRDTGPVPSSSFEEMGIGGADLEAAETFMGWIRSARPGDPCPIALADLDALTERLMRVRCWYTDRVPSFGYGGDTTLLAADQVTALPGNRYLARAPRVLLVAGEQTWVGVDAGYTAGEVRAALELDLTGDRLPEGIAALRAASS